MRNSHKTALRFCENYAKLVHKTFIENSFLYISDIPQMFSKITFFLPSFLEKLLKKSPVIISTEALENGIESIIEGKKVKN